jgi:hypothetical protein
LRKLNIIRGLAESASADIGIPLNGKRGFADLNDNEYFDFWSMREILSVKFCHEKKVYSGRLFSLKKSFSDFEK